MFKPGVSRGTRNIDAPWWTGTSGFVIAIAIRNSARSAWEEKYFSPSITQESPSRTARQRNSRGSAPPCGSVMEKQETMSPSRSGWRYFRFCSSVP